MDIREALRIQAPSLTLQRAACDLIADLDYVIRCYTKEIEEKSAAIDRLTKEIKILKDKT